MRRVLIAGCGYVGKLAAQRFAQTGAAVTGLVRSEASLRALKNEPFEVIACDIAGPQSIQQTLGHLEGADLIVNCASSGFGGAEAYRQVYLEGCRNLLALKPARFIFTSSTSVYAQNDGSWVDEASPAAPERETSRILRETEELVLANRGGIVARLAGIYGPGRAIYLQKLLEGTAVIEGTGDRFINQIHQEDAADALLFLGSTRVPLGIGDSPALFNVCDNHPMTQLECYQGIASKLQKPLPPFGPTDLQRKRGVTSKRVSNAKLRGLGWSPGYPSFFDAPLAPLQQT